MAAVNKFKTKNQLMKPIETRTRYLRVVGSTVVVVVVVGATVVVVVGATVVVVVGAGVGLVVGSLVVGDGEVVSVVAMGSARKTKVMILPLSFKASAM